MVTKSQRRRCATGLKCVDPTGEATQSGRCMSLSTWPRLSPVPRAAGLELSMGRTKFQMKLSLTFPSDYPASILLVICSTFAQKRGHAAETGHKYEPSRHFRRMNMFPLIPTAHTALAILFLSPPNLRKQQPASPGLKSRYK